MLYEILIRATDLLQEITAISGSYYTVGEDIPPTQQDFEGYVAWVSDASWTQERVNDTQNRIVVTYPLIVQSPQVLTGQQFTTRAFIMKYVDAIKTKFIRRPRLMNSTGQALNGIETSGVSGGRITVAPYPDGQQQIIRYRGIVSLVVSFLESNPC